MLDRSYYQLRKYLAANFKCDLDCPTIKTTLEALDACNFIAAYQEIGKMISNKKKNAVVINMSVQNDPVMDIKLRACQYVLSLADFDPKAMAYAMKKNLDFACCSRSSYGDCLIGLLANIAFTDSDSNINTVLEQIVNLSKVMYRTDYDLKKIKNKFPESFCFIEGYLKANKEEYKEESKKEIVQIFLEKVQRDADILENEWNF